MNRDRDVAAMRRQVGRAFVMAGESVSGLGWDDTLKFPDELTGFDT
jgi:hypothetical protein